MTGRARLTSGELIDYETGCAAVQALKLLLDADVWSIIHPDLKSADDGFYDYPALRRGAVFQARQLLAGQRTAITKPIIAEILRHSGLFRPGTSERLVAADIVNDDTRKTVLAAISPNYGRADIDFKDPIGSESSTAAVFVSPQQQ